MDLLKSIAVAASGLKAQSGRMRVIAENIANADSTANVNGGEPYRRRVPTFHTVLDKEIGARVVGLGRVRTDPSDFRSNFEPGNPRADENGYVKLSNVNTIVEAVDMREAQRSYQANLNVVQTARQMVSRALDVLRA